MHPEHSQTITIGAHTSPGSRAAHYMNGPRKVLLAFVLAGSSPQLARDGAAMREALPQADPADVLDLLASGEVGEREIPVRPLAFPSRRDADFVIPGDQA